jgi:hypothetical protein
VVGHASPEKGQGLALQEHKEHEHQASKDRESHDRVEKQNVRAVNADTHQENANGDLAEDRCETESNLAKPPVL